MNHSPDLLPHVRYMPSGHVLAVAIAASLTFLLYKVLIEKIELYEQANVHSYSLAPISPT